MDNTLFKEMSAFIDTKADWATKNRQDFHKYAEAGWHEVRTCSIIMKHLVDLGYTNIKAGKECIKAEDRMGLPDQEELDYVYNRALEQGAVAEYAPLFKDGFTGIVAILETGKPGPVIGIRTDIDALGVVECLDPAVHRPAREGFASMNEGEMHACGHDCHATINMTLAETLMKFKDRLCGTVKLVFQPSEEGVRGAKSIVGSGILDDVQYMMAVHMGPHKKDNPKSQLTFHHALNMANAKMDVFLTGKACHAASPENGNNAMLAMATIVQNVYAIPRASVGDARINVGQVFAGSGRNVVCDRVKMVMELRGLTQASLDYLKPYAERIIHNAAAMHGCTAEIKMMGETPCYPTDDPEFAQEMYELAVRLGFDASAPTPDSTSEDYTYMAKRVMENGGKSCFIWLDTDTAAPGHAVTYDVNEKDLPTGVKMFAGAITYLMGLTE